LKGGGALRNDIGEKARSLGLVEDFATTKTPARLNEKRRYKMAWIDLTLDVKAGTGDAVNPDEVFLIVGRVVNNLPWKLKECKWVLNGLSGPVELYPPGDLPQIVEDEDIAAGGTKEQGFALKCTAYDAGGAEAHVEFKWVLDDTNLTFPVEDSAAIHLFPG
jgi:hypothetical protein